MKDIKEIMRNLNSIALGGAKIPHGLSNPVLRKEGDSFYIAVFIYLYSRDNLREKKMPRPIRWIKADIKDGDVIAEYSCQTNEFSDASYEKLYSLDDKTIVRPSKEYFTESFALFEDARESCVEMRDNAIQKATRYLDTIIAITPEQYRRFYVELANLQD